MKNKETLVRAAFLGAAVLMVAAIVALICGFRLEPKGQKIAVGAVYIGAANDNGWNENHHRGLARACDEHGCALYAQTGVPEEEGPLKDAVAALVKQGCRCIFLTSYGYGQYANDIAKANPRVAFYTIAGDTAADNCMTYFARMYQGRYLAGIVAGAATRSGVLGYVSAMPIPETVRSINAYALGAHKANPAAKVLVKFTGSWNDPEKEKAAVQTLAAAGADVMTFHEDSPYALEVADAMGLLTTGYDSVPKGCSHRLLTAAVFNWGVLYERVLSDYLRGRANFSGNYWLGVAEGAVALHPYSDLVSDEAKKLVAVEEEKMKTWRDVFSGEIYDNAGALRCHANERIGDAALFNSIDWYVKGVEVHE